MATYHDPEADDGIECDESGYLYGHPVDADCELTQDGIGEGFESMQDSYEFLAVGAQSVYSGYDIAQTPYNWTVGRCCRSDIFFEPADQHRYMLYSSQHARRRRLFEH